MQWEVTRLEDYFDLPNPDLRTILLRNERGYDEDIRPPFWKGQSRSAVLAAWAKVLDASDVRSKYPTLFEYENEMREKVGPMSYVRPFSERKESVESYYTSVDRRSVPINQEAILDTCDWLKPIRGLRAKTVRATVESMRLNTFSGQPYCRDRRDVVEKTIENLDPTTYAIEGFKTCAILGERGQEGGPTPADVKNRVTWMFPMS